MNVQLPDVGDTFSASRMRHLVQAIRKALQPAVSSDEAAPMVILRAPNGGIWEVTIDNAGVITTTKVQG